MNSLLLLSALLSHQLPYLPGPMVPNPYQVGIQVSSNGGRLVIHGNDLEASADRLTVNGPVLILEGNVEVNCPQRSLHLKGEQIRVRLTDGGIEMGPSAPFLSPQLNPANILAVPCSGPSRSGSEEHRSGMRNSLPEPPLP